MKKIIYLIAAITLFACGSSINKQYESTIAAFVKPKGAGDDYQFKADQLQKLRTITVADSIDILKTEFDKKKVDDIAYAEKVLKLMDGLAEVERGNRFTKPAEIEKSEKQIAEQKSQIVSLNAAELEVPERYATMNAADPLVVVIRCKFTITVTKRTKITATETFDFYLSPDGSLCYKKIRADEN